jgi:hypothetical protein
LKFRDAYAAGDPVKVSLPHGGELLVFGWRELEDGVGYVDDGYFDTFPTRPCVHFIPGKPKDRGDTVVIGGHVFRPVEQGDWPAVRPWQDLVAKYVREGDIETIHDVTEWMLWQEHTARLARRILAKQHASP